MADRNEVQLQALWREYRAALPDPDARPEFMPRLWQRIDARRNARRFEVFARRFAALGGVLSLAMALLVLAPARPISQVYASTWLEVLAEDQQPDVIDMEAGQTEQR